MPAATDPRAIALADAADMLGGQRALAKVLNVSERSVRAWLAGDRSIGDGVLGETAAAVARHADACLIVAIRLQSMIPYE